MILLRHRRCRGRIQPWGMNVDSWVRCKRPCFLRRGHIGSHIVSVENFGPTHYELAVTPQFDSAYLGYPGAAAWTAACPPRMRLPAKVIEVPIAAATSAPVAALPRSEQVRLMINRKARYGAAERLDDLVINLRIAK